MLENIISTDRHKKDEKRQLLRQLKGLAAQDNQGRKQLLPDERATTKSQLQPSQSSKSPWNKISHRQHLRPLKKLNRLNPKPKLTQHRSPLSLIVTLPLTLKKNLNPTRVKLLALHAAQIKTERRNAPLKIEKKVISELIASRPLDQRC